MQTLVELDAVKQRMLESQRALKEADNWTTLLTDVEEVFASQDIDKVKGHHKRCTFFAKCRPQCSLVMIFSIWYRVAILIKRISFSNLNLFICDISFSYLDRQETGRHATELGESLKYSASE